MHCCSWFFFESHDLRYIADQPRPLASGEDAVQQPIGVVGLVIIHVNELDIVILVCRNRAVRLLQCFKFPYFRVLPVC